MRLLIDDYPAAARDLEQALGIFRDLGDRLGQANALTDLGVVRLLLAGDYPAARDLEQALGIYRDLGNRRSEANTLRSLGEVRRAGGITRPRPGTWSRPWVSTAASAISKARPTPSPPSRPCGG